MLAREPARAVRKSNSRSFHPGDAFMLLRNAVSRDAQTTGASKIKAFLMLPASWDLVSLAVAIRLRPVEHLPDVVAELA